MDEILARRLKDRRKECNMSQKELVYTSKISRGTISAIENGKADNVKIGTLKSLAKALGTTVDYFFNQSV